MMELSLHVCWYDENYESHFISQYAKITIVEWLDFIQTKPIHIVALVFNRFSLIQGYSNKYEKLVSLVFPIAITIVPSAYHLVYLIVGGSIDTESDLLQLSSSN
jgi:hypothetical protein